MTAADYIIVWRHRTDYGSKGKGTKRFTLKEAAFLAQQLNADHPHIEHWAEALKDDYALLSPSKSCPVD